MNTTKNILIIEDLASDVELIRYELKSLNFPTVTQVVENAEELSVALKSFHPEVVLSDYMMPEFTGLDALEIVKKFNPTIPFIIVTGSMNESTAVECMKVGAWDYVIKENLSLLAPAIKYALNKKKILEEKTNAEKALKASEEQFRVLFETAPIGIYVVELDMRIRFGNKKAEELTGIPLKDIRGKSPFEINLFLPEDLEKAHSDAEQIQAGKPVQNQIYHMRHKSGKIYSVEVHTEILNLSGKDSVLVMLTDITRRQQAEKQRQQAMDQFRNLVENSNDAIYMLYNNKFEIVNSRFTELTGYSLAECNKSNFDFINLVAPESRGLIKNRLERMARGEAVEPIYEFTVLSKSGQRIECEASVSHIEYKNGVATQGIIRDISARKKAEEQIRILSTAVEQSPNSVEITDLEGNLTYVNPKFEHITGYSADEVLGQNPRILKSGLTDPAVFEDLWKTITSGKTWQGEFRNKKKNGDLIWEEAVITPIKGVNGETTRYLALKQDVTQKKELEEQFRQAQKMEAIGQLAGGVAHDFNNILTVINGYSEIALAKLDPNDLLFEPLQQIKQAGLRAGSLTRQLLAFSRKQILQPVILNLNELVKNMEKMLYRLIGENINLVTNYAPDLGKIKADPGQVEQVLLNLVVNAHDAMPNGGTLTISTENSELDEEYVLMHKGAESGSYVMLAVTDTGHGMDKQLQNHIFEPFFTTKGKDKGTGLGLSTVYGIVKQSGGYVWVYSEPGKGTTFKVYFHVVESKDPVKRVEKKSDMSRLGSETVLIVEDEDAVRSLAALSLQKFGFKVIEAEDGNDALEKLSQSKNKIDILLSDVIMPNSSGVELAGQLSKSYPDLKVVFMSGYTDDSIVHQGVLADGMNFIQKPFTPKSLAQKIRDVIDADK